MTEFRLELSGRPLRQVDPQLSLIERAAPTDDGTKNESGWFRHRVTHRSLSRSGEVRAQHKEGGSTIGSNTATDAGYAAVDFPRPGAAL
jgi:hypothetical protein